MEEKQKDKVMIHIHIKPGEEDADNAPVISNPMDDDVFIDDKKNTCMDNNSTIEEEGNDGNSSSNGIVSRVSDNENCVALTQSSLTEHTLTSYHTNVTSKVHPIGCEGGFKFKNVRMPTILVKRIKRSSLKLRWVILVLAMLILLGTFYAYDIPAPLHQQLEDLMYDQNGGNSSNFEVYFNLLYTVYSFPNIILPFIGGQYVDIYGAPFCLFIFTGVVWFGQILFATGAIAKSWPLMLFGRFVFGFGGENVQVAVGKLLSQWFSATELSFAFGTVKPIGRLGSVVSNVGGPIVANKYGTGNAILMGVGITILPLFISYFLGPIDKEADLRCTEENYAQDTSNIIIASLSKGIEPHSVTLDYQNMNNVNKKTNDQVKAFNDTKESSTNPLADASRFSSSFWLLSAACVLMYACVLPFNNVVSGLLLERNYFRQHSDSCVLTYDDRCTTGILEPTDGNPSRNNDGYTCATDNYAPLLPSSLYIIFNHPSWDQENYVFQSMDSKVVNCDDRFWSKYCTKDYCKAEEIATEKVGRVMSIPYVTASVMSPIIGYWVGKNGHRASLIAVAFGVMFLVHSTLAFTQSSPILPLLGQGTAYGIFTSVIWSSVPLTVEEDLVGTAFGVMTSFQNTGLAITPLIVAGLYNLNGDSYLPSVEVLFIVFSMLGLVISSYLLHIDKTQSGGVLNKVKPIDDEMEMIQKQRSVNIDDTRSDVSSVFHELT